MTAVVLAVLPSYVLATCRMYLESWGISPPVVDGRGADPYGLSGPVSSKTLNRLRAEALGDFAIGIDASLSGQIDGPVSWPHASTMIQ